ncbi:LOW QUALITY PROTEIN: uncharacterized protein ARIH2OS [Nomascus leucogenys]|uniref:LOW QUALITY PROTEIN: uncharacterized protein ARIH2OS n=1 Tax=Nomascus leucogenys TaxID=61853 RepID=UPI00122DADAB|nr:LOW QUALITY PROTEIN: uncharacterized protein ARIH2OS [Nomascus leucogenys]
MLGQCTGDGERPGLPGDGEGGVPARPGRRAQRPPQRPAKINKAVTCATHLPGAAASRPLSPNKPDRVRPGQRDRNRSKRQRRQRADAGQARAASSRRVVPAAPEVLGAVASLPDRGRPTVAWVATGSWLEGLFSAASLKLSPLTQSLTRVRQAPTASGATIRLPVSPVEMFLTSAFLTGFSFHCLYSGIGHGEDILVSVEQIRTIVSRPLSGQREAGPGISAYTPRRSLDGPRAATTPGLRFPCRGLVRCPVLRLTVTVQDCILTALLAVSFHSIGVVIMTSSYLLGPVVKWCG